MAYKTITEIYQDLAQGARWWNEMMPDTRFKLGEVYTVRIDREGTKIFTGQVVYSVRDHHVQLLSEDGNDRLYIYLQDKVEILEDR